MPLTPVNLAYFGDLYRFFLNLEKLPEISLESILCYEDGTTHADPIAWEDVPLELKEMLIERVKHL